MSKSTSSAKPRFALALRKFLLSFFVVFTFVAYAIRNQMDATESDAIRIPTSPPLLAQNPNALVLNKATAVPTNGPLPTMQPLLNTISTNSTVAKVPSDAPTALPTDLPTELPTVVPTAIPTDLPTDTPTDIPTVTPLPAPTATPQGQYKDGTYDGPVVDAYYGNVQVEAIVQGGKITDVQFLDYPKDRRTSREINQQAMPWLTQEAVQVQNANVDLIGGATFTSEAFVRSLQSALDQAHT